MTGILNIIASSTDHVLITRDASSPMHFPSGTPDDLRQLFIFYETIRVFAIPPEGGAPRRNSLHLKPIFFQSLGMGMPPEYECPEYEGYKNAYTLGYLWSGNAQLILDLSGDSPAYRLFCYYPVVPFEANPILSRSITDLLIGMLNAGPDSDYIDTLIKDAERHS